MTDDVTLRDRIAAALAGAVADYLSYDDAYTMADAAIAELGLHRETTIAYYPDEKIHEREHRYVTDWTASD